MAAGNLAYGTGRYAQARVYYEECLALLQESGDERSIATVTASLANVVNDEEDYERAHALFTAALSVFQKQGDQRNVALTLGNLAIVACAQEQYDRALALHQESLAMLREIGDPQNMFVALNNQAETLLCRGDTADAVLCLEESLTLSLSLDSRPNFAHCLTHYRTLAVKQECFPQAALIIGSEAALREILKAPLPPRAAAAYARHHEFVWTRLGATAFRAAYAQGYRMTQEQMTALLRDPEPPCR